MTIDEEIKRLESEPCTCVICPDCNGTGSAWWSFGHKKYLGKHRWDDLDELEPCENCHNGVIESCDRCYMLADLENQRDWQEEQAFKVEGRVW